MGWYYGFKPYVPVADRIANAAKEIAKLHKKGRSISPIKIHGKKISETFWGQSWCQNLEHYSDLATRLPRGRSYLRNGSVVDLQIQPGRISALVAGSQLYEIEIKIKPLPPATWKSLSTQCAGQIASILELLSGKLSKAVMEIITHPHAGLFPKPAEIDMDCSCPDGAYMCKHLAAVLYGIGSRLDHQPELLFLLRRVDHLELIQTASTISAVTASTTNAPTLADADLADVFGIEFDAAPPTPTPITNSPKKTPTPKKKTTKKKKLTAKKKKRAKSSTKN